MLDKALELQNRTKKFALSIITLYRGLPRTGEARVIGNQVLRSGTSVASNYRAACRSRSKADFISKIGIVVEEADETVFWLELIIESRVLRSETVQPVLIEASQLLAIFSASRSTARGLRTTPNRQIMKS
jgi:four helix bundle protein